MRARPVDFLWILLLEARDRLVERLPGAAAVLDARGRAVLQRRIRADFGECPAQVAERLEVVRILARALVELLHRLVQLAAVVLHVAPALVAQPLNHVLNSTRAVRIARVGRATP